MRLPVVVAVVADDPMLYDTVKTASYITESILLGFSGGKDSVVALSLCLKYFKKVQPFFMHIVPGLSFQESIIKYYEDVCGIEMIRLPHFVCSDFYRYGSYRAPDNTVPIVSPKDTYEFLRERTGIYWVANGERIADSIVRRAKIKSSGTIDEKRGMVYPVAEWTKADIVSYIKLNRLKVSAESEHLGFSFRGLTPYELMTLKNAYPGDWGRIKEFFPFADIAALKGEIDEQNSKKPEV